MYTHYFVRLSEYSGLDSGFHYHPLDLPDCIISLPENIPFRQKFPKCLTCIFITRCVSWLCLLTQKKKECVKSSHSYFNSVYKRIARKQTDSFCPTPLTCIGVTFRLTPATNALRHRAPDQISCQQLGVWTVVYGTLCSRGKSASDVCLRERRRKSLWGFGLACVVVFMRWFSRLS